MEIWYRCLFIWNVWFVLRALKKNQHYHKLSLVGVTKLTTHCTSVDVEMRQSVASFTWNYISMVGRGVRSVWASLCDEQCLQMVIRWSVGSVTSISWKSRSKINKTKARLDLEVKSLILCCFQNLKSVKQNYYFVILSSDKFNFAPRTMKAPPARRSCVILTYTDRPGTLDDPVSSDTTQLLWSF